jgi:glycerol-3-phosphate dehydrogenase
VHDLAFIVPSYIWWESPFYGLGLKLYDHCPASTGFGQTTPALEEETLELLPTIRTEGLRGGVVYYDGQFDDSRLLINLVTTAAEQGATIVNYVRVSD